MGQARFSQLPRSAVMDNSLSPIDFKVLAVIGLYLGKDHEAWPSQDEIGSVCEKSASTVSRSIKRLEKAGYIVSRKKYPGRPGTHKCYAVVFDHPCNSETIKNDSSQHSQQDDETVKSDGSVKNDHSGLAAKDASPIRTIPIDNSNELSNEKPKSKKSKRGTQIGNWTPGPMDLAFARKKNLTVEEINHALEAFPAHHRAKGTVSKDWSASWRTWCLNTIRFRKPDQRSNGTQSRQDAFANVRARMAGYPDRPDSGLRDDERTIDAEFEYVAPDARARIA